MAVQINVAANQAALVQSIQQGVAAYNARFASQNQINLSVNQRAFSQPLGRITGDVKDFNAAMAASNARVIAFGASTAVLGSAIKGFKSLAESTIEVEKNLADINRILQLSTKELQNYAGELFNIGKRTATSFNDASKALLEFSRQGLNAEETLKRTNDALILTRLAGMSAEASVEALTATVNGFIDSGITTTQVLNKLVAVEQSFAVSARDLSEGLSRTGQAAQEAGVNIDELNALITVAQQKTARGGAVIGNALKTIFTRLQRSDTLDQLEAFNIAVRDVQGNTLPAVTILQNFASAYNQLADAQRSQLSEQVAGVYQVNILKGIVSDLNSVQGIYNQALSKGAGATNEAQVANAKLNQTLSALLSQLSLNSQQAATNIGKITFEPLAKNAAQAANSVFESFNEILTGEGIGSDFANGFLKGIRNLIAGPGAIAAFYTLFKLIQNSFTYLTTALPQIAGITTQTQNRKNIEQAILQIMQQQGPISQALSGQMGNQTAQAQLLLQLARQQTAEYQRQTALAQSLAASLAGQGVRVSGGGGLQVRTRSSGYIPRQTAVAEQMGALAGGYAPGKVVPSPVGGVMNTAEQVKYVPGFAQPFINPPSTSRAGKIHRANAIKQAGVDPYMNNGFIPNFAEKILSSIKEVKDGDTIAALPIDPNSIDYRLASVDAPENNQKFYNEAKNLLANKYLNPAGVNILNNNIVKGKSAYFRSIFNDPNISRTLVQQGLAVPDFRYTRDTSLLTLTEKAKKSREGIWGDYTVSRNGSEFPSHPKARQYEYQKKVFFRSFKEAQDKKSIYKSKQEPGKTILKNKDLFDSLIYYGSRKAYSSGYIPHFANTEPLITNSEQVVDAVKNGLLESYRIPGRKSYRFPDGSEVAPSQVKNILSRARKIKKGEVSTVEYQGSNAFDIIGIGSGATQLIGDPYENLVRSKIPGLIDAHGSNKVQFNLPFTGGGNSFIDFFNPTTKTFYEAKGGSYESEAVIKLKFDRARNDLANSLNKQLQEWKNALVYNSDYFTPYGNPLSESKSSASGFIPNFAYKNNVMNLEEKISGKKAIFDTKPFPHIRNSGQPTFNSAIADHGGLNNALSDSIRNQVAAGLMNKGYIPNFADFRSSGPMRQKSGRMVSNKQIDTAINSYIKSIDLLTTNNVQINAAAQQILKNYNLQGPAINNLLKQIKAHANAERSAAQAAQQAAQQTAQAAQQAAAQRQTQVSSRYQRRFGPESGTIFQRLGGAFGGFSGRQRAGNLERRLGGLSNNVGFQLAAPIVGGLLEQVITQGKDRSQLSVGQRFAGNAASSVLTGMSTGAALGTAFGGPGIGTAIGAVIGLGNAAIQAGDSVQDLANAADQYKAQITATLDAGKSYIEQLNQLASISDPSLLNQATYKLSETFLDLNRISPELGKKFYEASGDVEKMRTAMQEFAKTTTLISNIKKLGASYKEAGDALSKTTLKKQLQKKGYDVETYGQEGPEYGSYASTRAEIKTTEGSLQTSFVQFQGFFDLLKEGGLRAEDSANFIEEFQKEMQGATTESTLKAIAQKYNISETVAAELAALSDNVIDEMGIEGDFFVKNSAVLIKRFYDETDKKFKTATQQAKEVQFNSRELLLKLRSGIDNYIFNVAKQIQEKEFESSRLSVLDNAVSEFIDKLISPLESGARQAKAKIRQTSISQETERMRLSSDIAGASGKQIFETLGGGDKGVIEGLQKTVDNLQDPNLLKDTLKTLIQQTSSAQAAKEAGFKVGDPEKLATFNAQLKQQLQNTIMLSEKQKQQLEIQNLELELLNRRSEAAQVLLDLEFQLINSELERNKVLNKSVTDNQIRTAKEKAIFERPGYGFGMSPTGIQSQKANQERAALQRSQAIEREKLFSGGEDFFKSRITKVVQDLKSARLIQSKNVEDYYKQNPFDKIFGISSNKESDKYNNLLDVETKLQAFSTGQIKSVDDYKKRLEDLMGVLTPVSDTNKQIYDEVAKQLKAVNDLTEAQRSESKILDINLENQRLQALQISIANKFYNERLQTLLETADAEQRAADALEVRLQALDTYQSRESNFYNGLGVMGNAGVQVGLNNKRLAIRQEQTTQQNVSSVRGAINEFATYRNEIANFTGPLSRDQQAAKNAIANINTEIKNLDDAKAFADNLAKARNSLDFSSEDAKKLATFENQVRGILQKNTSELEKQKEIQDLINKGVLDEAADRTSMAKGFQSGFNKLISDSDEIGFKLGQEIPSMFADGMSNALMEVAKGTKSIGDAFKDMAINFGQTLMQEVMRAAIGRALGSAFGALGLFGNQKGGIIHAQNGMYISGGRTGDRNLALLEDGEYVLNRNAVRAFGGKAALDKFNFKSAPRFGAKMATGGVAGAYSQYAEQIFDPEKEIYDYTNNLIKNGAQAGPIDYSLYSAYAYEEDDYFKKVREKAIADEQQRVQDRFNRRSKNVQLISSIVGAAGSMMMSAGLNKMQLNKATKGINTKVLGKPMDAGKLDQIASMKYTAQKGGYIGFNSGGFVPHGSRLNDTIPALLTGGEYVMNNNAVKKYGLSTMNSMNAGAYASGGDVSNSSSTTNNTNNNATNISINVDRSGNAVYGADSNSYSSNDIILSKKMARQINSVVMSTITDQKRYGGKLHS